MTTPPLPRPVGRNVLGLATMLLAGAFVIGEASSQGSGGTTWGNTEQPSRGPAGGEPGGGLGGGPGSGPPVEQIARDLGLPADKVRAAFRQVGPPTHGPGGPGGPGSGPPTDQQRAAHAQKLAAALGVPVERLRPVLDKYRPSMPPRS